MRIKDIQSTVTCTIPMVFCSVNCFKKWRRQKFRNNFFWKFYRMEQYKIVLVTLESYLQQWQVLCC